MFHILGHYVFVDGAAGTFGTVAELIGPTIQPTSSSCQMQFYYYIDGFGKWNACT